MEFSNTIGNISAALVKAQEEMKNPYNSADNPFFKSRYAPLDSILSLVRPILARNGIVVMQSTGGDGTYASITTTLVHSSGEWIRSDVLMIRPAKLDPQGIGSALTYGRRYSLSAILGIAGDDDDDANSIVEPPKAKPTPVAKPAAKTCPTCKGEITFMRETEFEGAPVGVYKCGTCKKLIKLPL